MRYVDDLLLFGEDKAILWGWRNAVVERLAALRLTVHPGVQPRPVEEGIPFLGFTVYPDRRRRKRRKGVQFQRKLRGLVRVWEAGELDAGALAASLSGWVNHARYGNTVGLRKAVLHRVPESFALY